LELKPETKYLVEITSSLGASINVCMPGREVTALLETRLNSPNSGVYQLSGEALVADQEGNAAFEPRYFCVTVDKIFSVAVAELPVQVATTPAMAQPAATADATGAHSFVWNGKEDVCRKCGLTLTKEQRTACAFNTECEG